MGTPEREELQCKQCKENKLENENTLYSDVNITPLSGCQPSYETQQVANLNYSHSKHINLLDVLGKFVRLSFEKRQNNPNNQQNNYNVI